MATASAASSRRPSHAKLPDVLQVTVISARLPGEVKGKEVRIALACGDNALRAAASSAAIHGASRGKRPNNFQQTAVREGPKKDTAQIEWNSKFYFEIAPGDRLAVEATRSRTVGDRVHVGAMTLDVDPTAWAGAHGEAFFEDWFELIAAGGAAADGADADADYGEVYLRLRAFKDEAELVVGDDDESTDAAYVEADATADSDVNVDLSKYQQGESDDDDDDEDDDAAADDAASTTGSTSSAGSGGLAALSSLICSDEATEEGETAAAARGVDAYVNARDLAAAAFAETAAFKEGRRGEALVDGDYVAVVHIIEARELNGENFDGTSDPFVEVRLLGQTAVTRTFKAVTSAVWDEKLFFRLDGATRDELARGTLTVEVFDENLLMARQAIGRFTTDFEHVYAKPGHELYREWVGLIDNTEAGDDGIQGYLQVSIESSCLLSPRRGGHLSL